MMLTALGLILAACGPSGGTDTPNQPDPSTPVADTGGPKVTGYSMGGGGTVAAGQQALVATFSFKADVAKITGTPKLTFKGVSGSTLSGLMTATCTLADARHLACKYPVTAADVGKASSGIRFDGDTALSGGTVGTDGKTAPISQGFGGGTITILGTTF